MNTGTLFDTLSCVEPPINYLCATNIANRDIFVINSCETFFPNRRLVLLFCLNDFGGIHLSLFYSYRYYENHPNMQDKAVMLYHKVYGKIILNGKINLLTFYL